MGGKKAPKDNSALKARLAAEAERKKTLERQRRGLEGTIKTSYEGDGAYKRKNLLGE